MKTKTKKKPTKKSVLMSRHPAQSVLGRHFGVWRLIILVTIVAVGYEIVRANNDAGLLLTTPSGSIAREAQLDTIELQRESQSDQTYDQQQLVNAQGDSAGLSHLGEVINDAIQ
jgi:hypothetical protein